MAAIEHWYEITCEDLTLLYHFHIDVIFYVLLPFLKQKKTATLINLTASTKDLELFPPIFQSC